MGKSSKQTTESESSQKVDPSLVKDYLALTDAGRALAGVRTQPNRGVTTAGFTPAQQQAMAASNQAAGAFGMNQADYSMPPTMQGAGGVEGYSYAPYFDEAIAGLPDDYTQAVEDFYRMVQSGEGASGSGSGSGSDSDDEYDDSLWGMLAGSTPTSMSGGFGKMIGEIVQKSQSRGKE